MSSQQAQAFQEDQLLELLLQLKKTTSEQARAILNSQPQIAYALMAVMVNLNAVNVEVVQKTLTAFGTLPGASTPSGTPSATPIPAIPPHIASQTPAPVTTPTYPTHSAPPPQLQSQAPQPTTSYAPPPPQGPSGYPQQSSAYSQQAPTYSQSNAYPSYQLAPQSSQPQYHAPSGLSGYGVPPSGPSGYGTSPSGPSGYSVPPQLGPGYGAPPSSVPPTAAPPPVASSNAMQNALSAIPEDQKALIIRVISLTPEEIHAMPQQERSSIIQLRATLGVPT